jgi:hypothetical protein
MEWRRIGEPRERLLDILKVLAPAPDDYERLAKCEVGIIGELLKMFDHDRAHDHTRNKPVRMLVHSIPDLVGRKFVNYAENQPTPFWKDVAWYLKTTTVHMWMRTTATR